MTQIDLTPLARQARLNSEKWFPDVHSQGEAMSRLHFVLGLSGESGELCNIFKKVHTGKINVGDAMDDIGHELADVFTYLLLIADSLELSLVDEFFEKQAICKMRWE